MNGTENDQVLVTIAFEQIVRGGVPHELCLAAQLGYVVKQGLEVAKQDSRKIGSSLVPCTMALCVLHVLQTWPDRKLSRDYDDLL